MLAYKGFDPDLTCRGYQFDDRHVNCTDKATCVRCGFHAAENPLDCFTYYPNFKSSVYYLVDCRGDVHEDGSDTKIACTEMKLIRRLSLSDMLLHALIYMSKHPQRKNNNRVQSESGIAFDGFTVVRGMYPRARGEKIGDILALAQEDELHNIISINVFKLDGKRFKTGLWYDVKGESLK